MKKILKFDEFTNELKSIWQEFETSTDLYFFQTFNWQKYWSENMVDNYKDFKIHIFVYFIDNEKKIILPLFTYKKYYATYLNFIGGDQNDYNQIIKTKDINLCHHLNYIFDFLPKNDICFFFRIPFNASNFNKQLPGSNYKIFKSFNSHQLHYPVNFENYIKTVSKKLISDINRSKRKLMEIGDLIFEIPNDLQKKEEIIKFLLYQKQKQYINTGARNILQNKFIYDFYYNLCQNNIISNNIHISALYLDKEIIACHLGFVFNNRFYYIFPTYIDGRLEKFSPGKILLYNLIEWSFRNNIKIFDFTTGSESYKLNWCNNNMQLYTIVYYNSIFGKIHYFLYAFIQIIRSNTKFDLILKKLNKKFNFLQ